MRHQGGPGAIRLKLNRFCIHKYPSSFSLYHVSTVNVPIQPLNKPDMDSRWLETVIAGKDALGVKLRFILKFSSMLLFHYEDCSPPGSSVHGISQARTVKWVAISSSRGSSRPRDQPMSLVSLALQAKSLPKSHLQSPALPGSHLGHLSLNCWGCHPVWFVCPILGCGKSNEFKQSMENYSRSTSGSTQTEAELEMCFHTEAWSI